MWRYSCPRCGSFYISSLLYERRFTPGEPFFKLACIAFEWNLRHRNSNHLINFVLTDEGMLSFSAYKTFPDYRVITPDEMLSHFPNGHEIIRRSMLNLALMTRHPVDLIRWDWDTFPYAMYTTIGDVQHMAADLAELGYVRVYEASAKEAGIWIRPKGWEQIAKWNETPVVVSRQAFVAMWFDPQMSDIYKSGIEPAVKEAGFECRRIDGKEHNNKICDEIVAEIRKSRFLVADFTQNRGGVYFEAGFAMGLGLPVIWVVRKDDVNSLHFDTRQYNHIVYDDADDLKAKLCNRIVATIR